MFVNNNNCFCFLCDKKCFGVFFFYEYVFGNNFECNVKNFRNMKRFKDFCSVLENKF